MGLDIYLYRTKSLSELKERQAQHEAFTEMLWATKEKYEDYTQLEKDKINESDKQHECDLLIAKGLEFSEEKIEIDSSIDKEHYFKVGYFRSSYNEGGINRKLSNLGIDGLNEIFDCEGDYMFAPDWTSSLIKCEKAITDLENAPKYGVEELHSFGMNNNPIKDAAAALRSFLEEKKLYFIFTLLLTSLYKTLIFVHSI